MTHFGETPDGSAVDRITLTGGGLTAHVLTYGTVLQDLRLKGHDAPLVLGFNDFAPYLTDSPYFGATAGRCGNRIRDGHLELDGKTYQLDTNFLGKHCLHGGATGVGRRVWTVEEVRENAVTMSILQKDGDNGFPGNLTTTVTYSLLDDGIFDIVMRAETDAPTVCNLLHHSYFNFGDTTISDHMLQIASETYLPVDDELIPTGEIRSVAGTRYDFHASAPVSQGDPIDINYCLSDGRVPIRPVARLTHPPSGVSMEIRTTEPGLQVYDAARTDIATPGLTGAPMPRYCGLALEPQFWPDALHHPHFPQPVLRPGETYRQHTQYVFSKDPS